jgi:cytochrome c553
MKYKVLFFTFITILTGILLINCNESTDADSNALASADSVKTQLEKGKYLVTKVALCLDCHSERNFEYFSGPIIDGTEGQGGELFDHKNVGVPGTIYARNITPDEATGIGTWSDDEIFRAITQGIRKNGDTLFPLMPYPAYNQLAKEDIHAIIAYIKTLKPVEHTVPQRQLMIPIQAAYPPNLRASLDSNRRPAMEDKVKYGEYLVKAASCFDCHTPMENGQFGQPFTGGYTFHMPGFTVNSANLTSDPETGIGAWSEEQFLNKFTQYRNKEAYAFDAGKQNTIMPWALYSQMDDYDLKAIYAFLKTLPPVKNKIEMHPVQTASK